MISAIETVQKVQRPHKSTAVERSDELAAPKKKGTVKMQVSKKIKVCSGNNFKIYKWEFGFVLLNKLNNLLQEKLMAMPAKERKAFLRELKAKKRPNFELGEKCKMLWETIRRYYSDT
jgi:type IV secretory pathway VirB4 component